MPIAESLKETDKEIGTDEWMTGSSLVGEWKIDPAHSEVNFEVTHLMISKVRGRFSTLSGTVVTDGAVDGSRIEAEVNVGSVDTHDAARDVHLRSVDFFDASKYPIIKFVSTKISQINETEFKVNGALVIRGVTNNVEVAVTWSGEIIKDPWGADRAGFSATLKIDRRDFDLSWNQTLAGGGILVSNDVKLTIDVEMTRVVKTE